MSSEEMEEIATVRNHYAEREGGPTWFPHELQLVEHENLTEGMLTRAIDMEQEVIMDEECQMYGCYDTEEGLLEY